LGDKLTLNDNNNDFGGQDETLEHHLESGAKDDNDDLGFAKFADQLKNT